MSVCPSDGFVIVARNKFAPSVEIKVLADVSSFLISLLAFVKRDRRKCERIMLLLVAAGGSSGGGAVIPE